MTFDAVQREQLLKPLNPSRVRMKEEKFAYLSQEGVRAHAIRLFGFGGFDSRTIKTEVLSVDPVMMGRDKDKEGWHVCVLVTMEVIVKDRDGYNVCTYSESAVGFSTQGVKGEALDMAVKSGASDAFKRCFINLGDQFGLALYNPKSNLVYDNRRRLTEVKPVVIGLLKSEGELEGTTRETEGTNGLVEVTELAEALDPLDDDSARAGV